MAVFISNGVGVHSIEDDFIVPAGWSVITEAEARKVNPDLFGEAEAEKPAPKPVAKKATEASK